MIFNFVLLITHFIFSLFFIFVFFQFELFFSFFSLFFHEKNNTKNLGKFSGTKKQISPSKKRNLNKHHCRKSERLQNESCITKEKVSQKRLKTSFWRESQKEKVNNKK